MQSLSHSLSPTHPLKPIPAFEHLLIAQATFSLILKPYSLGPPCPIVHSPSYTKLYNISPLRTLCTVEIVPPSTSASPAPHPLRGLSLPSQSPFPDRWPALHKTPARIPSASTASCNHPSPS